MPERYAYPLPEDEGSGKPAKAKKGPRKPYGVKLSVTYDDYRGRARAFGWTTWYATERAQLDALSAKNHPYYWAKNVSVVKEKVSR